MPQLLAPIINEQQFDANGDPLVGGSIFVYLAGTSTPATTYNDRDGLPAHANSWPITLNTLGVNSQGPVWIVGGQAYKFVIKDAANVTLRTIDNVSGINDTTVAADQWVAFQGQPTYITPTTFTLGGDQTAVFYFGSRVKTTNTGGVVYATVVQTSFAGGLTTVVVTPDSGVLDSGLSSVQVGLITSQNTSFPGGLNKPPFRNRFSNGSFRIDIRGWGASKPIIAGVLTYTVDRWYTYCTGADVAGQRVAGTGTTYAFNIAGAASNTQVIFGQRIESLNCEDWPNKLINVQAPISAVGVTAVTWTAYIADSTDNFATKTSIAAGTLTVSGTPETKFFNFQAGPNVTRGLCIEFATGPLVAGQSIKFQGALQVEADQISPFEAVDPALDLMRCQRYFETGVGRLAGMGAAGVGFSYQLPYKVSKRAVPSLGYAPTTNINVTTFDARDPTADGLRWYCLTTTANPYVWDGVWTASAEL
jgi:hypothetical protein